MCLFNPWLLISSSHDEIQKRTSPIYTQTFLCYQSHFIKSCKHMDAQECILTTQRLTAFSIASLSPFLAPSKVTWTQLILSNGLSGISIYTIYHGVNIIFSAFPPHTIRWEQKKGWEGQISFISSFLTPLKVIFYCLVSKMDTKINVAEEAKN